MNNLITVITVVYNDILNLEKTILSVINQTYKNIEYIIIDGGSTDGTVDLIKKYQDNIGFWHSEKDNGIYDAMNKGISYSNGSWVCFMNSGDVFADLDILMHVSYYLDNNNDIIYGDTNCIYDFGKYVVKAKPWDYLQYGMPFCHQSAFVKTDVLRNSPFNLSYKYVADYNFFYECYLAKRNAIQLNLTISDFDAVGGVSSIYRIAVFKEILKIQAGRNSLLWRALFTLSLYRYLFLERMKKYFPNTVNYLRKRKLS